ncbi:phage tail tube protein [Mannheimia massilioguelmaensis]|uniref:phage tail tube protein n=1 Tax=Mannheimia massilioguelmaensis TaxID=1604354 RepID=UPI0005C83561|nr:phage tail tube protein [Mannheimia massilioguelmaensis]
MPQQYQGKAYIRINGAEYPTDNDGTLTLGGMERETVKGSRVYGYSEKPTEATVETTVFNCSETDAAVLKDLVGVTVEFETDIGQTYLLPDAWVTDSTTLSADGKVKLKFAAVECKRI